MSTLVFEKNNMQSLLIYLCALLLTVVFIKIVENTYGVEDLTQVVMFRGVKIRIKKSVLYVCLSFIPMWVLIAFRDMTVGVDSWGTYYKIYRFLHYGDYSNTIYAGNELGYSVLNRMCLYFSDSYQTIIIVTGTITWFLFFRYIVKNSSNPSLSMIILFVSFFYFHSFNGIRQFMAMGILLQGMNYIYERKLLKYSIVVFIAMMFHVSAAVFFIFYFLYPVRISVARALIGIFSAILLVRGGFSIIAKIGSVTKYGKWFSSAGAYAYGFTLSDFVIDSVLLIVALIITNHNDKYINIHNAEKKVYNFNIMLLLASVMIAINSNLLPLPQRLLWYTNMNNIIFVPKLLGSIENRVNKLLVKWLIVGLYSVSFVYYWYTGVDGIQNYSIWRS